jgi:hypothetical protein
MAFKSRVRKRFFLAVEGSSEKSFIRWLQLLSDAENLFIHLDCEPLNGGGYEKMFNETLRLQKYKERTKVKSTIMLIDADREAHDSWSLTQLREKTTKHHIKLCLQHPNHEGLLLRLHPDNKSRQLQANLIKKKLSKLWPAYEKPVDAQTLATKFTMNDLFRAAKMDAELKNLLSIIGFNSSKSEDKLKECIDKFNIEYGTKTTKSYDLSKDEAEDRDALISIAQYVATLYEQHGFRNRIKYIPHFNNAHRIINLLEFPSTFNENEEEELAEEVSA